MLPQNFAVSFPFDVVPMGRAPWAAVGAPMTTTGGRRRPGGHRGHRPGVPARQTGVVLLDGPPAALGIRHRELVLRIARERAAQGDAVVVVLHDLALAAAYADRVAILSEGRIAAYGPPAEVFTARPLSDVYSYEVEIVSHPRTGVPLVLPVR